MRGYHFTSLANWQTIRQHGLEPYRIKDEDGALWSIFHCDVFAIWVWPQPHDLESELGTVLYQAGWKRTLDVVQLWVDYAEADVLKPPRPGDTMRLWHNGEMGNWRFHTAKESVLLSEHVPPERVGLVREYHMLDLVTQPASDNAGWLARKDAMISSVIGPRSATSRP